MELMGRHFKAPPQGAVKQWWKVELLFFYGHRFAAENTSLSIHCRTLASTIEYLCSPTLSRAQIRGVLKGIQARRARVSDVVGRR